jgi:hypothetical protein
LEVDELRRQIRAKIIAGTLPADPATKVWAGAGTGRRCDACGERIKASDTEIEVERVAERPSVYLHRQCFALWREECGHS